MRLKYTAVCKAPLMLGGLDLSNWFTNNVNCPYMLILDLSSTHNALNHCMRTLNLVLDRHTRAISVNVPAHICHTAFNVFVGCVQLHVSSGVFNGSETAPVIAASFQ